jgi:hypothetical protein
LCIDVGRKFTVEKLIELLERALAGRWIGGRTVRHGFKAAKLERGTRANQVAEQIPVAEALPAAIH